MRLLTLSLILVGLVVVPAHAQKKPAVIPHGQSQPPGPPLTPQEALSKMKVPDGFTVELVASEPDIVNPVAMTFDERGRIWITESLEYPRKPAGPGRDRVKVLEDTDGDGKIDKVTIFAEGLNIPSGIAVGAGGVWVANAPDILFYREGPDGKAAGKPEVVVTGFGRLDTHELPNSLTWGPDGWLYGLNGVFNPSVVKQGEREFRFTCALFRIHPRTREFQLFCEGTSNPWGVAWDTEGSAFVSACVIDHLWHLAETGYYHRQGGPYPPFTWKLGSIVKHKHQKAAYCGIHFFDSDAYPPEYREKLYMGNIHGGCINSDELTRDGSTYFARPRPDFLTANDAWFMPVVQKTGPDGCLWVLDWYDRYHCYQDANRDPPGIDRLRGRLYRVRYKDSPRAGKFDLARETDDQLIQRLSSPNVLFRDLAQRLLWERKDPATRGKLEELVLDDQAPRKTRLHALWALIGTGSLEPSFHQKLLAHADTGFRAWGVRAAGNSGKVAPVIRDRVVSLARDVSADVRLQVAIAARKLDGADAVALLTEVLSVSSDDKTIPNIVWQNLHPLVETRAPAITERIGRLAGQSAIVRQEFIPRLIDRVLGNRSVSAGSTLSLLAMLLNGPQTDETAVGRVLTALTQKIQTGELMGPQLDELKGQLQPQLLKRIDGKDVNSPLVIEAALLLAAWKDPRGVRTAREVIGSSRQSEARRLQALEALIAAGDVDVLATAAALLGDRKANPASFRGAVLGALGRLEEPRVAEAVLKVYAGLEPELQPRAIELLTQRPTWARSLLQAMGKQQLPAAALNLNQVQRLLLSKDKELVELVRTRWGSVRMERNEAREQVIADVRALLRKQPGDPFKGQEVFKRVCAQCHKMHGEGSEVGPDITVNGRASMEQLLSNVLDPSRVIGVGYQARLVFTKSGRSLTGLAAEDNDQRVVLKVQGGKLETIPRKEIEESQLSPLSMMPEDLEKQLKPDEIVHLFAYLALDRPPTDPAARRIPEDTPRPPAGTGRK